MLAALLTTSSMLFYIARTIKITRHKKYTWKICALQHWLHPTHFLWYGIWSCATGILIIYQQGLRFKMDYVKEQIMRQKGKPKRTFQGRNEHFYTSTKLVAVYMKVNVASGEVTWFFLLYNIGLYYSIMIQITHRPKESPNKQSQKQTRGSRE